MRIGVPFKLSLSLDYEGIEDWLNEKSSKGIHFVRVGYWGYYFETDLTKRYTYKIELLKKPRESIESQNYLHFLKEIGIDAIPTKGMWSRWVWFKGESIDEKLNFYSDIDSKLEYYNRLNKLLRLFPTLFVLGLILLFSRIVIGVITNDYSVEFVFLYLPIVMSMFVCGYLKNKAKIRKLKEEKRLRE